MENIDKRLLNRVFQFDDHSEMVTHHHETASERVLQTGTQAPLQI
jgi:hypothetical protein